MATKTINRTYPSGFYLNPNYQTLIIGTAGKIYGEGVTTGAAAASTIDNFGTVDGTGFGVTLADGGAITNGDRAETYALVEGLGAVVANKAAGTLTNFGTVQSTPVNSSAGGAATITHDVGVVFNAGGALTNEAGGAIESGVSISGAVGSIDNSGVLLGASNSVTEDRTGVGAGGSPYHYTINDYGRASAVDLADGGAVINGASNNTLATCGAIVVGGAGGTISNFGSIQGRFQNNYNYYKYVGGGSYTSDVSGYAVSLTDGGTVTNGNAADHHAFISSGVTISSAAGTVSNFGTIDGSSIVTAAYQDRETAAVTKTATIGYAVVLGDGGKMVNGSSTDSQALAANGVSISGAAGTVLNYGVIDAASYTSSYSYHGYTITSERRGYAVVLGDGGKVTNGSSTDASTSLGGVSLAGAGTITNFGSITGAYDAVKLSANGTIAAGTFIEEGSGALAGEVVGGGGTLELGAAGGTGTISGLGSTISGFGVISVAAGADWYLSGTNTIVAGQTFSSGADTLDIDTGYVFTLSGAATFTGGVVDGGGHLVTSAATKVGGETLDGKAEWLNNGGLTDTGVLTVGDAVTTDKALFVNESGGVFDLSGAAADIDAGASVSNELENGGLLERTGAVGTSVIAPRLVNTGTIEAATGTIDITGIVSGTGLSEIRAGATLEFSAAVGSGGLVDLDGSKAVLLLADAAGFKSQIEGFTSGRTIDLRGGGFAPGATLSYSGTSTSGTLTVRDGASVARIALLGQYAAANFKTASDGAGGLDITFAVSPAPALATPTQG